MRRRSNSYSSSTLTQSEIAEHVHETYENGSPFKKKAARKKKAASELKSESSSEGSTIPSNELLNKLNRYPALLLNADFQVRAV
jgi:hypothetical protein